MRYVLLPFERSSNLQSIVLRPFIFHFISFHSFVIKSKGFTSPNNVVSLVFDTTIVSCSRSYVHTTNAFSLELNNSILTQIQSAHSLNNPLYCLTIRQIIAEFNNNHYYHCYYTLASRKESTTTTTTNASTSRITDPPLSPSKMQAPKKPPRRRWIISSAVIVNVPFTVNANSLNGVVNPKAIAITTATTITIGPKTDP